ncbi:MAG TPA: branched-chain amino acid ABC transporter permease [Fimbriimonadaceae bacterium]|nr:branched-chain amino acid ABC transporter permease [Fimbriimonadaceae bacterium]
MFWPKRIASIAIGIGACFLIQAVAGKMFDFYGLRLVALAGLYVTLAVSLNLINGITGQFSIGHAAFYQIGAYFTGYLSIHYFAAGAGKVGGPVVWLIAMMIVGALGATIAGFVVGLPSLRLRGDYLAIVTLGFGEILRIIVQNQEALGGAYAMKDIPTIQSLWLVWALAFLCIAVCRNLLKTARGLTFVAVREDEVASAAMGVDVTKVKITAFMVGSAFAGAAGALLAHYEGLITPQTFAMDVSFIILTMVVLGGTGSITGSVVAAIFLSYLPEYLRNLKAPDGGTLYVTGATCLQWMLTIFAAVVLIRWISRSLQFPLVQRLGLYAAAVVGALVIGKLLGFGVNLISGLAAIQIDAGQLRMAIFAVALISVMLIRPQGIFAHHELSLTWLRGLVSRKRPAEVSA